MFEKVQIVIEAEAVQLTAFNYDALTAELGATPFDTPEYMWLLLPNGLNVREGQWIVRGEQGIRPVPTGGFASNTTLRVFEDAEFQQTYGA